MHRLIFLLLLVACSGKKEPAPLVPVGPPPAGTTSKSWLALGDSYTIGQGVEEAGRFPTQTVNLLRLGGINIGIPTYIAATGWTTTALQNAINTQQPGFYDVVSLLIGVNDQYLSRDTTGYRQRFTALLQKAIELTRGRASHVFVLSIPDYSVTPFAAGSDTARIRQQIDWFNAINRQVTLQYNCPYLDITPSTREARTNPALLASDGLHPSAMEYRRWADRLSVLMLPVLR